MEKSINSLHCDMVQRKCAVMNGLSVEGGHLVLSGPLMLVGLSMF